MTILSGRNRFGTSASSYNYRQINSGREVVLHMEMDNNTYGSRELEFAIFCIENVASKLNVDAIKVYDALTEYTDILKEYIIPEYEVLHTQSKDYIVNDIIDIMKERDVKI